MKPENLAENNPNQLKLDKENEGKRRKDHDFEETFDVLTPRRPQDNLANLPKDYLYITETADVTMWPASDKPLNLPQIDFCFGDDTLLQHLMEEGDGVITRLDLMDELNSTPTRLLNWDNDRADELIDKYWSTLAKARKIAYIATHGESAGEPDDRFWALSALDVAYGADRIVQSFIDTGEYDLIVLSACNPDNLPLTIENDGSDRPTIIRFNMINKFGMKGQNSPISIIPAYTDTLATTR